MGGFCAFAGRTADSALMVILEQGPRSEGAKCSFAAMIASAAASTGKRAKYNIKLVGVNKYSIHSKCVALWIKCLLVV